MREEVTPTNKFVYQHLFLPKISPKAARGCLRGGGRVSPPPKKQWISIFYFCQKFTERATVFAGLQRVLERGEDRGDPGEALPPLKMFQFFQKLSPKGPLLPQAARGCWRRR